MILPAFIFTLTEDDSWDLFGSIYFTFVTLSTIGFGDYVPATGDPKLQLPEKASTTTATVVLFCYYMYICFWMFTGLIFFNIVLNKMSGFINWIFEFGVTEQEREEKWSIIFELLGWGAIRQLEITSK